jgi:hypothetical protein
LRLFQEVVGQIGGYTIQGHLYRAFQRSVGDNECSSIYYDLRTGKQYVEVYYLSYAYQGDRRRNS